MRTTIAAIVVFAASSASAQYLLDQCKAAPAGPADILLTRQDEAGDSLEVSGLVVDQNGKPVPHVFVRAFQADARGIYTNRDDRRPRICGVARTDSTGHYRFRTILPGPYPNSSSPAHIHFEIWSETMPVQRAQLEFEGDRFLNGRKSAGRTDEVRPLIRSRTGTLRCERDLLVRR